MPELSVSERLYRQIEDAADGRDTEQTMWEMVYQFQRGNSPSE